MPLMLGVEWQVIFFFFTKCPQRTHVFPLSHSQPLCSSLQPRFRLPQQLSLPFNPGAPDDFPLSSIRLIITPFLLCSSRTTFPAHLLTCSYFPSSPPVVAWPSPLIPIPPSRPRHTRVFFPFNSLPLSDSTSLLCSPPTCVSVCLPLCLYIFLKQITEDIMFPPFGLDPCCLTLPTLTHLVGKTICV